MRPPKVSVLEFLPDDGNPFKRLFRTAKHAAKRQQTLIWRASATRVSMAVIARLGDPDESHVRKMIYASHECGFESLDPGRRGGLRRRITDTQLERIVSVTSACPQRHRRAA
jgi:hypothetical protein